MTNTKSITKEYDEKSKQWEFCFRGITIGFAGTETELDKKIKEFTSTMK